MSAKNFIIKNGLTIGSTEAIDSSGDLTAAAFGTAANEAIDDRVNALLTAGTGIFKFRDGTRTSAEMEARGNKEIIDNHSQDYTKWELVDRVGNVFNRLVLFNSTQFHASLDYFGTCKEDARLFQVFSFSTER